MIISISLRLILILFIYISVPFNNVSYAIKPDLIYIVKSRDIKPFNIAVEGFVAQVKSSGETDIIYNVLGKVEYNIEIVKDIKIKKPDAIFTVGTNASKFVKKYITGIPIIFAMLVNPEKIGLINNIAIPENSISGVSLTVSPDKQLMAITMICNSCKRIGILYNPEQNSNFILKAESAINATKNMELVKQEIHSSFELSKGFQIIFPKIDLLWLIPDHTVLTRDNIKYLIKTSVISRLPVYGLSKGYVAQGALLSFHLDYKDIGRQAGAIAIRVLKGERSIPVETPEKTRIVVNLNIAHSIGLNLSRDLLNKVEVFEK